MIDKHIEKFRYNERAISLLDTNKFDHVGKLPKYLNTPYEYYFKLFISGVLNTASQKY
jgi:hypothetical protein